MRGKLLQRLRKDIAELGSPNEESATQAEHRICRAADRLRSAGPQPILLLVEATRHPHPRIRLRAGWALAATRAPGVYPVLEALTRDPDEEVRYDTVMALGRFRHFEAIALLAELACQPEREDQLDSAAAMALGSMGRRALRSILPLLGSSEPRTRELAVWWLGQAGPRTMAPVLGERLNDGDPQVRINAIESLGIMGERLLEPRCLELLAEKFTDPDPRVRELAEYWYQEAQKALKTGKRRRLWGEAL